MKTFIKKHPWLLFKCIALTMWVCGVLAGWLNKSMLILLDLKGKDPNPPPPPVPEPSVEEQMQAAIRKDNLFSVYSKERPKFNIPYVPEWVAKSFKDPSKHPIRNVKLKEPQFLPMASKPTPEPEPVVTPTPEAPLAPTVVVGGEAINSLREAVFRMEAALDLPSEAAPRKLSKKKSVKNKG